MSAAMLGLVALPLSGAGAQEAGDEPPPQPEQVNEFEAAPTHGPPGTAIEFTGRCTYNGHPAERAHINLLQLNEQEDNELIAQSRPEVAEDGTFAGQLVVPDETLAGDHYQVTSNCFISDHGICCTHRVPFQVTATTSGGQEEGGPGEEETTGPNEESAEDHDEPTVGSSEGGATTLPETGSGTAAAVAAMMLAVVFATTLGARRRTRVDDGHPEP